ncbi:4Fe-4S dicluster domain-containing protein [bacterium]|nr:4Fe-4S dicluster domain-containing protein [bacterium]
MLVPTVVLSGIGLLSGLGLALAARAFAVESDPRQDQITEALPGANCGGCGYAGCGDFAGAVVRGDAKPDGCPVCDQETRRLVASIVGLTVQDRAPQVALILCQGGDDVAAKKYRYNGLASCASAALLGGGDKLCSAGCLGLGDCQRACAFGAIEMTPSGVARIIPARCTACGQCVAACPKDLIKMVPAEATIHVLCSNHDRGPAAKKACTVACLGCKKCEKSFAGDPRIKVSDFLAYIDYEHAPVDPALAALCPTGSLVYRGDAAPAAERTSS